MAEFQVSAAEGVDIINKAESRINLTYGVDMPSYGKPLFFIFIEKCGTFVMFMKFIFSGIKSSHCRIEILCTCI